MQRESRGALCRSATSEEWEQATYIFDPEADFTQRYATRRASLESHIKKDDTLRVQPQDAGKTFSQVQPQAQTPEAQFNRFVAMLRGELPGAFAAELTGEVKQIGGRVEKEGDSWRGYVSFRVKPQTGNVLMTRGKDRDIVMTATVVNGGGDARRARERAEAVQFATGASKVVGDGVVVGVDAAPEKMPEGLDVAVYRFTDNKWVFVALNLTRHTGAIETFKYVGVLKNTGGF